VGEAAGFGTPTATIDDNTGTPSVTVTASGPNTEKVFNFEFRNLKGVKGDKGDKGDPGPQGPTGEAPAGTPKIYYMTFTAANWIASGGEYIINIPAYTHGLTSGHVTAQFWSGTTVLSGNTWAAKGSFARIDGSKQITLVSSEGAYDGAVLLLG